MSKTGNFENYRRQPFISESAFHGTMRRFDEDRPLFAQSLQESSDDKYRQSLTLSSVAGRSWDTFLIRYTAGEKLETLSAILADVVSAYEAYADVLKQLPDWQYHPPIILDDEIDEYVDYVNLLSAAVLLHREDLIPRISALIEDTDYDGEDLIIESLLSFYMRDRPALGEWFWEKPYSKLVDVLDSKNGTDRARNTA